MEKHVEFNRDGSLAIDNIWRTCSQQPYILAKRALYFRQKNSAFPPKELYIVAIRISRSSLAWIEACRLTTSSTASDILSSRFLAYINCKCEYVYTFICRCTYTYIYMYNIHAFSRLGCLCIYTIGAYICMCIDIHMYMWSRESSTASDILPLRSVASICIWIYTYIYTCIYMCAYMYIY